MSRVVRSKKIVIVSIISVFTGLSLIFFSNYEPIVPTIEIWDKEKEIPSRSRSNRNVTRNSISRTIITNRSSSRNNRTSRIGEGWIYDATAKLPYDVFDRSFQERCRKLSLRQAEKECSPVLYGCSTGLQKYKYILYDPTKDQLVPLPKFNVTRFREKMKHKRILLFGSSLMRQQFVTLGLALNVTMENIYVPNFPYDDSIIPLSACSIYSNCCRDEIANITVCFQFMASVATKKYYDVQNNYTFNLGKRGPGDSSCVLSNTTLQYFGNNFEVVLIQSIAWWGEVPSLLDSPTSPGSYVTQILPRVYYDAMKRITSTIGTLTKAVFVLGHKGVDCPKKNPLSMKETNSLNFDVPLPHTIANDPYGWQTTLPILWKQTIDIAHEEKTLKNNSNVDIIDVRKPLMSAVNAHYSPNCGEGGKQKNRIDPKYCHNDCLHFCINSAGINAYLDYYQYKNIF